MSATLTPPKEMTLPELRKFDGQLFARNNTPMKVTCREKLGSVTVDFELEPAGQPDSIGFLPKEALDVRGFQRLWMRGSVTISTDPEIENEILMLNNEAVNGSTQRMSEMLSTVTENDNHRELEEKWCLQCGNEKLQRGRIFQNKREVKDGTPPLCPAHVSLAPHFVPRQVTDGAGNERWEFDSVTVSSKSK